MSFSLLLVCVPLWSLHRWLFVSFKSQLKCDFSGRASLVLPNIVVTQSFSCPSVFILYKHWYWVHFFLSFLPSFPCSLWDLSFPTRDWSQALAVGWTQLNPNNWTSREFPRCIFLLIYLSLYCLSSFTRMLAPRGVGHICFGHSTSSWWLNRAWHVKDAQQMFVE